MKNPLFAFAIAPLALAACASTGGHVAEHLPAAEGTAVPLGKAVETGNVAAEPLRVIEDSRCPINARCIWAGRLILETALTERAVRGWSETAQLTLGEPYSTHGITITLVSAEPGQMAGKPTDPKDYRFSFEGGR
jgi:hypothetical protein